MVFRSQVIPLEVAIILQYLIVSEATLLIETALNFTKYLDFQMLVATGQFTFLSSLFSRVTFCSWAMVYLQIRHLDLGQRNFVDLGCINPQGCADTILRIVGWELQAPRP